MLNSDLKHRLNLYARKGGKKSRRHTVARIERFLLACHCPPEQIGRRQVHEFFERNAFARTTARDYYYAIRLLWRLLGRGGVPPAPKSLKQAEEGRGGE